MAIIKILALVCLVRGLSNPGRAQEQGSPRPTYKPLRYDEDWSSLGNRADSGDWFDWLKYIPLGGRSDWRLTVGGEIRPTDRYPSPRC
jgi:hypothetical protein